MQGYRRRTKVADGRSGFGRRRRWLLFFTILLGLVAVVPVAFGAPVGEPESSPSEYAPAPTAAEAAPVEKEERERAEWLESPEALQQREESETAFTELSSGEARSLLSETFAGQLEGLNGDPGRILSTLEVEKSLGTYGALIKAPNGESAILNSSAPLESEVGGEGNEPVDLTLEPSGQGFVPANPLEEVELPGSAAEPIHLEGGIGIKLPAEADPAAEQLGQMNLFYPETETDTDTLVAPRANGVEVFEQLRSPRSPEELRFELSLPEGAKLRSAAHGSGAEIVSAAGHVMAEVTPPTAADAQGAVVPVTMSVEGDSLVLEIAHRGAEVAYPILVDPNYVNNTTNFSEWALGPGNYGGYHMQSIPGSLDAFSLAYTSYPEWSSANWVYSSVGQTAYIAAATFSPIDFLANSCSGENPHGYVGIFNTATQSFEGHFGNYWGANIYNATWESGWVGGLNTRQAMIGIGTYGPSFIGCNHELYVGGYSIQEEDPYAPSLTSISGIPAAGSWFDPSAAGNATITASDNGLGVQEIAISDGGATTPHSLNCSGASGSRCPGSNTWTVAPPYVEGEKTLVISSHDPVGNATSWTRATKADGTAPSASVTATQTATTLNAKVETADGVAGNARSGVKEVKVYLDKTLKETRTNTCSSSGCPFTLNFTYSQALKGLAAGSHTVEVIAFDQLNHQHAASANFTLEAPNTVIDSGPEGLTSASTPKFTYHSTQEGSTFQCRVDTGAWVSCATTGYTTAKLAEGPHTFEVKATNGAGLEDPTPAKRAFTTLYAPDTTITFGPEGLTNLTRPVFAYESNNPEARFECKLDGGSFKPCNLVETEVPDEEEKGLSEGSHTFSVRAVDQLGEADPTPATRSISVDSESPTAEITSGPEAPTNETQPTFHFSVSGGTVKCLLESEAEADAEEEEQPFKACTTSSSFTPEAPLAEAGYVFYVQGEDEAENETEDARWFSVDTKAPETTITSAPPTITDNATPTIGFTSSEAASTFQCRYDAEAFRACSGPGATDTRAVALADGSHTFQVRATDAAGNADATPATAAFTVLTNGPQTSINSGPEEAIAATEATFTYSTDETASMECTLDRASFASCATTGKTYTGLSEGEHVFEVRGENKAGIADPTPARRAFIVDTSSPEAPVLTGSVFEAAGYGTDFKVEAIDGSNGSASSKRSGVRTVQILLGGQVVRELTAECEANVCPSTFVRTAQIPYEALLAAPAGANVEAKAIDGKGHSSTAAEEIKEPHENVVEPSEPAEGGSLAPLAQSAAVSSSNPECNETLTKLPASRYKGSRAVGTAHADLIVWKKGIKTMEGNGGCDVIVGGPGPTTITGGAGDDLIRGGGSDDHLFGQAGADRIFGGIGDDVVRGGAGADVLDGGPGADVERGEGGNDTLRGGQGGDELIGGKGTADTVSYADALPPGFVEVEKGEEEEAKGRSAFRKKAEEKGVGGFPLQAESGVYINLDTGKVFGGKLGQGGGTDEIKGDEHIVGSPFADWIEGTGEATEIEPGPGDDAIFSTTAHVVTGPGDWVDGNRVSPDTTNHANLEIGEYRGGGETDVYVIGSNEGDGLNVNPSGSAVKITANKATEGRLPASPSGCERSGNTVTCREGKQLGALLLYGGQNNDTITMQSENKNLPGGIELDGGPGVDELHGGVEEELLVDGVQHGSSTAKEMLQGNGGEDALSQGEGADKVEGGQGNDLFLNSRICEGDAYYADTQKTRPGAGAADNAQFHPLPNLGVYANLQKNQLGGKGVDNNLRYKQNCGSAGRIPLIGFNDFEGSPQNDVVLGNEGHNFIIGRGGENKLWGNGGNDLINAKNGHPELVINCGGQPGDRAEVDTIWDNKYIPQWKRSCPRDPSGKGGKTYTDGQEPGPISKKRKPAKGGSAKSSSVLAGQSALLAGAAASPEEGEVEEEGFGEEEGGPYPTAEFHLDETSGTSAVNGIEEAPPGTYMAKGTGPSVNGPGPVLGGESALLGGGEEAEPEEGSSISFNGENAYVDLAGQGGPEAGEEGYSLSLYVKFSRSAGQREYLFSSSEGGGEGAYLYRAADGSIAFSTGQGPGAPVVSSDPVAAGAWHQVVASFKGQTISLNVDGFPYELDYGSAVISKPGAAPESLLGAGPGVTGLLTGSLDEVDSYESAMSEGEVLNELAMSKAEIARYLPMNAPETVDQDGDGVPDGSDNCPTTANPDQADSNEDGIGDACQTADEDGDGIPDSTDNCPTIYNPEQTDTNGDGIGDACSNLSPEVETGGATAVKATSATIEGTVDPEGSATSYYFEYGPTTSYGTKIPASPKAVGSGIAVVTVSQALTGLTQGTTYHYRLVAANEAATANGEDQTLTTLKAPKATTGSATGIGTKSATLNGTVDPEGSATSYYFEYGPTTSYGTKIPASPKEVGAGTNEVAVSQSLTGLTPGATYHYRLVATSVAATTNGVDRTFATEGILVASELSAMALTDPFNATTNAVSNFSTKWSVLGWASGKGEDRTNGWGASPAYPAINGAYFGPTVADVGTGVADVATVASGPGNNFPGRYFALWLDLQTPGSTRGGYQLRFVQTSLNVYEVILAKWSAGTETVLATKAGYPLAAGSSFALVDEGSEVAAWTNTGSGFTQILAAADGSFSGGNGGVEASGNASTLTNFKIGQLLPAATNMSAALGALRLDDAFATTESPLSEGGTWAALYWDYASATRTGHVVAGEGWGPSDAWEGTEAINGAYWTKATFADTGSGDAAAVTLKARPGLAGRHFDLLLNMQNPATARSGYELRFTEPSANTGVYTATLVKWVTGTPTTLATQSNVSLAIGGRLGLADKAGVLSVWTAGATGEFTQLLSASDTTYQSGYLGIAGGGNFARLANFRGAQLPPF